MQQMPRRADRPPTSSEPVTREFGPLPPRCPTAPPTARHAPRLPLVVGALVLAITLAIGCAVALWTVAWPPERCAARAARPDVDGDGCAEPVWVREGVVWVPAGVLDVREATFEVGAPGDVVVLGDWDCDGSDTPGVYRPATGAIALFTGWPAPGALTPPAVRSMARARGTAMVVRHGRCDELVVS
jgi:hypothetical protein